MSTVTVLGRRKVLADLVPGAVARDVGLVLAVAGLTALAAQIRIPLPGSPVPITGSTFAVLLGAAALGPLRGSIAQAVYVALGLAGLPVFTNAESGVAYFTGATGGYLVGFVVASVVVGALARRGAGRRMLGAALAFAAGSLVIYALGVPWLVRVTGMPLGEALWLGAGVFLAGDAIKALAAGALLPAAWRVARRDDG
ncbi:MAG: biotin transporter BioY [Actinobacteria bacterium]|nr:biotin transporter BioY [Actinomycetota bacterium]